MDKDEIEQHTTFLRELGYDDKRTLDMISRLMAAGTKEFIIPSGELVLINQDKVCYDLHYATRYDRPVLNAISILIYKGFDIQHGSVNRMNTSGLDERMAAIDWNKDFPAKVLAKKNSEDADYLKMVDNIKEIHDSLQQLIIWGDTKGMGIALQLMLKYWLTSEYGQAMGLHQPLRYFAPVITHTFDLSIPFTLRESYQLMNKFAVCKPGMNDKLEEGHFWFKLEPDGVEKNGSKHLVQLGAFDPEAVLKTLPFAEVHSDLKAAVNQLYQGIPIMIASRGGLKRFLTIDPEKQNVVLLNDHFVPFPEEVMNHIVDRHIRRTRHRGNKPDQGEQPGFKL